MSMILTALEESFQNAVDRGTSSLVLDLLSNLAAFYRPVHPALEVELGFQGFFVLVKGCLFLAHEGAKHY